MAVPEVLRNHDFGSQGVGDEIAEPPELEAGSKGFNLRSGPLTGEGVATARMDGEVGEMGRGRG